MHKSYISIYMYIYVKYIYICMYRRGEERAALQRVLEAVARYDAHMNI